MHPEELEDRLGLIRSMMERTTRYSGLPATSCFAAGAVSLLGVLWTWARGFDFNRVHHPKPLALIWGTVCALGMAQFILFTLLAARRRGESAWSRLAQRVVVASLPGIYVGATLTAFGLITGNYDYLPPFWCLCYGVSLLGLGLYAGWKANVAGCLFLLAGTVGLHWAKEHGLFLMAAAFGGIHVLLGLLILWRHEPIAVDREV